MASSPDLQPRDDTQKRPRLSVVVPAYNEAGNIGHLVERLCRVFEDVAGDKEIVIVDDGSFDGTWECIGRAARECSFVRGFRLSRNFGHQNALLAGLHQARGSAVVSMDADLQHPPEAIPELLAKWEDGFEIVNTRRDGEGEVNSPFKRLSSKYFYRIFSALSEVDIAEGSSDFRLIDRRALDALLDFRDSDLFLRGAVQWLGFRTATLSFSLGERHAGVSKYNLKRMLRFAMSAIVSYSSKPLRLGIWFGLFTAFMAFCELVYILVQYSLGRTVPGWASILGVTSLLFGVLFVLLGIIGIYLADIHKTLRSRPQFIIAEETVSENLHACK